MMDHVRHPVPFVVGILLCGLIAHAPSAHADQRSSLYTLVDTAAAVNTVMALQDELANLTEEELELWQWGAQHVTGLRMCRGTPTVSAYLAILRQIRDIEPRDN